MSILTIATNKVVGFFYTLSDSEGNVLQSNKGQDPLNYLHGYGNIIPGLEKEMNGMTEGEEKRVVVEPIDAYGEHNAELVFTVPRTEFETKDVEIGDQFEAKNENGQFLVTVIDTNEDSITFDANHEMAGMQLTFDIEVANIREATQDEIEKGRPF
jgi:FKBP-type peptidyl-prolyl cis-trans isomerase SlyD